MTLGCVNREQDKADLRARADYMRLDREEDRRAALRFALASRLLTDEEMREVEKLGEELCEPVGESFSGSAVRKHFLALMRQQFRLRKIAESVTPPTTRQG